MPLGTRYGTERTNLLDGAAEMVLHDGRPVIVEGKKLYRVKHDSALIMRL